jgi:5'-methylthioadenosine phosphorylase
VIPLLGVIGGSGLYQIPGLTDIEQHDVETPFGPPSDLVTLGTLDGKRLAFLPRHGRHHQISPSKLPTRANIWALKSLGVQRLLSVSAVGSMREDVHPRDVLVPDQIFDRTAGRQRTFFDEVVVHVSLADPFCPALRPGLVAACKDLETTTHDGGTYICIEGPQFSTRAESRIYRSWGVDVIGMTAMPEARLAREAGLCYATLALVTDYDVWHETEEDVTVAAVIENLRRNADNAQRVIRALAGQLDTLGACSCASALENAVVTAPESIPPASKALLDMLAHGPRR